ERLCERPFDPEHPQRVRRLLSSLTAGLALGSRTRRQPASFFSRFRLFRDTSPPPAALGRTSGPLPRKTSHHGRTPPPRVARRFGPTTGSRSFADGLAGRPR